MRSADAATVRKVAQSMGVSARKTREENIQLVVRRGMHNKMVSIRVSESAKTGVSIWPKTLDASDIRVHKSVHPGGESGDDHSGSKSGSSDSGSGKDE